MSGGSWDGLNYKIQEVAERLCISRDYHSCYLLRRALGKQLLLAAKALDIIDYVDSSDCAPGDEREELEKCFKEPGPQVEARELLAELERLKVEVERVCAGMTQEK